MAFGRPRAGWPLLLLALGLGLGIERLVVTDAEAIEALLEEAEAAVRERRLERLRPLLAEDFEHEGRGPEASIAEAERLIERHRPTLLEVRHGAIVVAEDRAEVDVDVRALAYGSGWLGRLRLALRREDGGWRVLSAVRTGGGPTAGALPGQNGR